MSDWRWRLPLGWKWAKVSDIARIVGGGTPSSRDERNYALNGIPWITPSDLTGYDAPSISRGRRDISVQGYLGCGAKLLPKRSVLFSSRAPIGYCVIADSELCTSQGFKSLVLREGILPEFVRYYLLGSKEYAESLASGTTFLELSGSRLAEMSIPVAPPSEQHRVVNVLDSALERIERARSELLGVPHLLSSYRSRVLQAAYDAVLVEQHPGSTPCLGELVEKMSYGTSKKSHSDRQGVIVLRIPNVSDGRINLDDVKYTAFDDGELERLKLRVGDLLVVRSNGSPALVGRPAVVGEESVGMAFAGYLIRIRPKLDSVNPNYLSYMMQAPASRARIESGLKSTSGINNINSKQLAALPVPLCPVKFQEKLVSKLDVAFAWSRRVEEECVHALKRLGDLRTSLLEAAFKGGVDGPDVASDEGALEAILSSPFPKLPRLESSGDSELSMSESPRDILIRDSQTWPSNGLTYEKIVERVRLEHDEMRDVIFSLLGGVGPELMQTFDSASGKMLLKRASK